MEKKYLFSPGPTPIPSEVLLAMARPIIHHRDPAYEELFAQVREDLKWLFQTKNDVLLFASSGTGPMDGAVSNLLSKGDKVLVISGGKFGERWAEICEAYSVKVKNIEVTWGKAVDPNVIANELEKDPSFKAVFVQASETSTGVAHPIKELCDIVKRYDNTIIVVDAISALGVMDLPMDKWGIDVMVSGSQKAFMLPPGLAMIGLSDKAWKFVEKSDLPKYYFDFKKELNNEKKNQNAFTPAISLVVGLKESLSMMKKEGLENLFARHAKLAKATREAAKALGLELLAPDSPSNALTAIKAPDGIDGAKLKKNLEAHYGIIAAGGQAHLKGKIIRIAHIGYFGPLDIIMAISALEMELKRMGYPVELGKGVKIAEEILLEGE
ncbi:MAG: alanine--glyoxylate aminotransferase family protein [Deltaproteobacteria bacterium]|nr:alanine--glyoxylate aminotransferase family protein [Deltaproteobacteria bacterium]